MAKMAQRAKKVTLVNKPVSSLYCHCQRVLIPRQLQVVVSTDDGGYSSDETRINC